MIAQVTAHVTPSFGDDIRIARGWLAARVFNSATVARLDDGEVYRVIEANYPGGFTAFIERHC